MSLAYYNWQSSPYAGGNDDAPLPDAWLSEPKAAALIAEAKKLDFDTRAGENRLAVIGDDLHAFVDDWVSENAPRNRMGDMLDGWWEDVPSVDSVLDAAVAS